MKMQIGVIGAVYPDSFAENTLAGIRQLGHLPLSLGTSRLRYRSRLLNAATDYLALASSTIAQREQRHIVRKVREHRPDLVLSLDYSLLPDTVQEISDMGIPSAIWFPDCVGSLGRQLWFVSPYERIYMKDPLVVRRLAAMTDIPIRYLPEACNPDWHRPADGLVPGNSKHLTIAGSFYSTRLLLLRKLQDAGVELNLHGPPLRGFFPQRLTGGLEVKAPIFRHEKARAFRGSLAVLNNLHPNELDSMNCRLFEVAGSGGACIVESRSSLDQLFARDHEVLAYENFDELLGYYAMLAKEPAEGLKLGNAASQRAHAEHTYADRLTTILTDLGFVARN